MAIMKFVGEKICNFTTKWVESFQTAYQCTVTLTEEKPQKISCIVVNQKVGTGVVSWQATRNDARFEEAKKILEQVLNIDKSSRGLLPRRVGNW